MFPASQGNGLQAFLVLPWWPHQEAGIFKPMYREGVHKGTRTKRGRPCLDRHPGEDGGAGRLWEQQRVLHHCLWEHVLTPRFVASTALLFPRPPRLDQDLHNVAVKGSIAIAFTTEV